MAYIQQSGSNAIIQNTIPSGNITLATSGANGVQYDSVAGITNNKQMIPSGLSYIIGETKTNQIGGTTLPGAIAQNGTISSSTTSRNSMTTGILPIGTYILIAYVGLGSNIDGDVNLFSFGAFFDVSSNVVQSNTPGTPYHSSCMYIKSSSATGYIIGSFSGAGNRMQITMVINLQTPTNIYLNYYATYTGGTIFIRGAILISRIA